MAARSFLIIAALAFLVLSVQGFAPVFGVSKTVSSTTSLNGCRVNAKKEKIKRNRENMRKFSTGGRRGMSRRKQLKKIQASAARQEEAEFITKCFTALPAEEEQS